MRLYFSGLLYEVRGSVMPFWDCLSIHYFIPGNAAKASFAIFSSEKDDSSRCMEHYIVTRQSTLVHDTFSF